jgi:hypothetical protein
MPELPVQRSGRSTVFPHPGLLSAAGAEEKDKGWRRGYKHRLAPPAPDDGS